MKLNKVEFGPQAFRKLKNLTIDIAPRITVIAGHNGIGKSTILGLIANCSGVSRGEKSMFGNMFQSNFQEAFYLDYFADYDKHVTDNPDSKKRDTPKVTLQYREQDNSGVDKVCFVSLQKRQVTKSQYKSHMVKVFDEKSVRRRSTREKASIVTPNLFDGPQEELSEELNKKVEQMIDIWRLRIIPRTFKVYARDGIESQADPVDFDLSVPDNDDEIETQKDKSSSGKVPIPTIYLGMSRMAPIGEFEDVQIDRRKVLKFHEEDKDFIQSAFNDVLRYSKGAEDHLVFHSFTKSKKKSYLPTFEDHDTFAVSLGQDSLSSIVTALASFNQLKRVQGDNYKGGILVIDEVDAGFHPRAQEKLMQLLSEKARALNLQILLTTHSLTVIKKIFTENEHCGSKVNNVVYLHDPMYPRIMDNPTYTKIKNDMLVTKSEEKVEAPVKIYFEDEEAKLFFEKILKFKGISDYKGCFGRDFELVSLSVGCNILMKLHGGDNYFRSVVIVPDNDVYSEKKNRDLIEQNKSICPLPGSVHFNESTAPRERTPEMVLYNFIAEKTLKKSSAGEVFWSSMTGQYNSEYALDRVLTVSVSEKTSNEKLRETMKNWFNEHLDFIQQTQLVEKWCAENSEKVDTFIARVTSAVDHIVRTSQRKQK